jgi:hypothetical protein
MLMLRKEKCCSPQPGRVLEERLKGFGEFFGEGAGGTLRSILGAGALVFSAATFPPWSRWSCGGSIHRTARSGSGTLRLGRLRLIGAQQPVFEWSAIETADDGVHFFRVRSVDECETLRFLRLGISNHFHVVVYKVFCVKPGLDIVLGNPDGQISEENCEAHSSESLLRFRGFGKTASRMRSTKLLHPITPEPVRQTESFP